MACVSALARPQAAASAASSMWAAMKKSIHSLGNMRRPSSPLGVPPK
jgi:hypothetical protein